MDRLILEIEVIGFNADGMMEAAESVAGTLAPGESVQDIFFFDLLDSVMKPNVGLTLVTQPGEKEQNSDFTVEAMNGLIVGARVERDQQTGSE